MQKKCHLFNVDLTQRGRIPLYITRAKRYSPKKEKRHIVRVCRLCVSDGLAGWLSPCVDDLLGVEKLLLKEVANLVDVATQACGSEFLGQVATLQDKHSVG